jgi:aminoglycoside phosphotransferase (APT) family kinase protein
LAIFLSVKLPPGPSRFLVKPLPGSTGFLSRILVATRKGDPRRYILKVGSDILQRRKWAGELGVFDRELAAYRLLASLKGKLSPRLFSGASALHGSDGLLLLEFLEGARNRDQLRGLTWPELTSATRAIARIHARFWNSPVLKKAKGLPRHHYMRAHEVRRHLPTFLRWAKLPAKASKAFRALSQQVSQALARLRKQPLTLVHGDLRSDNIFYGRNSVRFIDWGLALAGNAAFDLARLAGGSARKPLSLLRHVELIKIWHAELLRCGVRSYPLHDAWQDYRDSVLLTLTIPVTNAPALASFSPRGRQMAKLITQRFSFSARELGIW